MDHTTTTTFAKTKATKVDMTTGMQKIQPLGGSWDQQGGHSGEIKMALAASKPTAIAFMWASLDAGSCMGIQALVSTPVNATGTPAPCPFSFCGTSCLAPQPYC